MSTSFPNSNGSVPPYNPQANGSFNQYAQNGPPGGYPGMEHYQHNMYAPNVNGYGGMPPGQPNMGGPAQPAGMPPKGQPPQQYPGPPGAGVKLPGYDANSMQNGYMGYPPHQQRTTGHPPQNGPPPNYNAHQQMPPPNNPYGGVADPYRMYSAMQGPPAQAPQNSSTQPAPPAQNANYPPPAQPAPPSAQAAPHQYPTQQPLPAHLHGGPPYQPPPQSAPLQHYQPPGYTNGTTPTRPPTTQAFPPLQPSKQAKQDDTRPNNLQQTPNQQYAGSFGGPGAPNGYDAYAGGSGGYPGYPPPGNQVAPVTSQAPGQNGTSGTPNGQQQYSGFNASLYSTPGPATGGHNTPGHNTSGQNTPGHHTPGRMTPTHQTPGHQSSGHSTPAQNTPSGSAAPLVNPYAPMGNQGNQGQFGSNDPASSHGTPGNYGGMNSSHSTPNPPAERATPGTPSTPTTPGASQQRTPQQQQQQPGMQNHMPPPPQYNHNPMASPNHGPNGTTPQKHQTPMGSSLPPLNGQVGNQKYPPMTHNMQSPVTTPTHEPTFKEPAIPIRHSPSHTQSPAHQQPTGAPPAYHTPSSSNRTPEATTSSQPARSPTFAVPALPAAKSKTSPQKKRGETESVPEPPSQDTPFTLVHNFELPAAMTNLKESISKMHPQVDKHYFSRKRQPLRHPYPEGANAHNTPATEPSTFGFIEGSKYFKEGFSRKITLQTPSMGPPTLSRSQSMLVSPGFNASQPSTSGRQPAKKARSASDASEPAFTMPLPPNRHPMAATDPRMQQMQMHQYHQQMHMQKMHQQQIAAQQQHMARMSQAGNMPSTSTAGGMPPAPGPTALPSITPPALQRAESMPQLPSQQQPPMGGQMPPHMAGMPPMNGNHLENPTANNNSGHTNNQQRVGLPPLTLRNPALAGTQSHDYPSAPSTSNQPPDQCAGCHNFISAGSPTLCCMYHDCKNVYHRQCTRLTSNAFNHFDGTPQARWVCPPCETQVRPMQMQHA